MSVRTDVLAEPLPSDLPTLPPKPPTEALAPLPRRRVADFLARNAFVILVLGLGGATLTALIRSRIAADSWYTLLAGRLIIHSGLPHHDQLTVMAGGRQWADQQWLAQVGFYELWHLGGWPLALVAVVALYVGALAIGAAAARRLGASDRGAAIVVALCFVVGAGNTVLRAQIIGYALFALVLALLLLDERAPSRRVFLVLPLLAVWANIHGSVLLGAGLVTLRGMTLLAASIRSRYLPTATARRAAALIVAPWLCVLASPYALELPGYYRHFLNNPTLNSLVTEWAPTDIRNQPIFFVLLFSGLWLTFRGGGRLTVFERLVFLATAIGGLLAIRNIVWCALAAAAVLPGALDSAWRPVALRRRTIDLGLAALGVVAALGATLVMASHGRGWFEPAYPRAGAEAVAKITRAEPKLRVYATEPYADWLLFEQPRLAGRVAYDIRFELLSPAQMLAITSFHIAAGSGWEHVADGYGVLALSASGDRAAIALLERERGTTILYRSGSLVVLRRPQ